MVLKVHDDTETKIFFNDILKLIEHPDIEIYRVSIDTIANNDGPYVFITLYDKVTKVYVEVHGLGYSERKKKYITYFTGNKVKPLLKSEHNDLKMLKILLNYRYYKFLCGAIIEQLYTYEPLNASP